MGNQTEVTEFIILGLSNDPQLQIFLFLVFLLVYLITLLSNMVIMVVIRADPHLHTPMYFFLSHLSFVDICYASTVEPKMLVHFLAEHKTISVNSCIAQMFFILQLATTEIFILSAMAYDRYTAICDPLRYMERMSKEICVQLVSGAWAIGFFHALLNTVFALKLHFCGPSQINHFSCELPPLLQLSCTESLTNQVVLLTSAVIFASSSFLLTLISYIHIISTVLRIHSAEGRRKVFSTCSSHLIVVGLFYLTGFLQYTKPSSVSSVVLDEMFSIQYSILTPMLNPIIYSLKNKEVKTAVGKMFQKFKFLK
ncbi:olfactory receptor 1009-like [Trachemys scripta elegans]|uniref:olfactory receptor 5G9-like n=1 Tax=Chrysemys picta bellii TaxID=8478 RepID=UPI0003891495|nr:olfactory receptor 1009-like [Chrysemys picta bellii]XP_034646366.1 olfactory receptor 1009-like [Trachemys scripta elegans]